MTAPANIWDPRYYTEVAIKTMVRGLIPQLNIYTSFDIEDRKHPSLEIKVVDCAEELTPGSGVYRHNVMVDFLCRPDSLNAETAFQQFREVRQCFYRNDTSPNAMKDLATRLTNSLPNSFTCYGVVPRGEGEIQPDQEKRLYGVRLNLEVHMTPISPMSITPPSYQRGQVALVPGQQSYPVVLPFAYLAAPATILPVLAMAGSSAESFEVTYDKSSVTGAGFTLWLNGIPSAASNGSYIEWFVFP